MTLKTEVYSIIDKIKALHPEDPKINDYWDELTEVLSADEQATINFLYSLEDKEAVNHISSVFHDVAYRLQSPAFIKCIESLIPKFPDLILVHMVNWAKEALDTDEDEAE